MSTIINLPLIFVSNLPNYELYGPIWTSWIAEKFELIDLSRWKAKLLAFMLSVTIGDNNKHHQLSFSDHKLG